METAQAETTAAREELDKTNARCKELEEQLKSGTVKFSEIKAKAATYKKSASDLKAASMKLEKMVAERSRGLEEHRRRIVNLEAELTEQRRIVTNLGDVRTTNEQLARSLKKERTKVDTMTTVNAKLASRLAEVEKENRRLCLTVAATAEPKGTIRDLPRATAASSSSAAINDAQIIDLVSETSIEADMDEDIDTLDNLIVQPVGRPIGQNPRPRPGTTFGMSLKEFMPPAAPDTLGGNSQSVFQPSQNPFAIADKPFESLIPKEIVFTQGRSPSNASPQRPKRPDGTAWRSQFAGMSNVLGGSRQSSTQRRKNTSTIQARITWGPKK
ncbi:hypothetical protein LPJ70_003430 [Coemansia sp. RSA 2708]|nr:hypothetical protein LPJ70_003430 [Coemansia sp. RSA 2708]